MQKLEQTYGRKNMIAEGVLEQKEEKEIPGNQLQWNNAGVSSTCWM